MLRAHASVTCIGSEAGAAPQVFTTDHRNAELIQRSETARNMERKFDAALLRSGYSDVSVSARGRCSQLFVVLYNAWQRWRGTGSAAVEESSSSSSDATAKAACSTIAQHRSSFFGQRQTPTAKLDAAAESMRARITNLEARSSSERAESLRLATSGNRAAALRMLKKAKATEAAVQSISDALFAVEQQTDMLAHAEIQKQLSKALASSSKAMKGDARLLSNAERAIDDAQEARDTATDLGNVMSEFANASVGDMDDDELARELQSMVDAADADGPPLPPRAAHTALDDSEEASNAGGNKQSELAFPRAPTSVVLTTRARTSEEKASLLQCESAAG